MNGKLPRRGFHNETRNQLSVCHLRKPDCAGRHSEQAIFERHINMSPPVRIDHHKQPPTPPQELADVRNAGHRDQVFHEDKYWHVGRRA
jgi:hypothetical protein